MNPTSSSPIDRHAPTDWIDEVLADSFPASDPPSWSPAIATLKPSLRASTGPDHAPEVLQPGSILPHFTVTDLYGRQVDYSSIWQRKSLVLVMLPDTNPASQSYAAQLIARGRDSPENDAEWLVTCDHIPGVPTPAALVADRWGELMHVSYAPDIAHLPGADELVEWVDYVRRRCPECEGEAR